LSPSSDPVRIAILGFGTVGRAVARLCLARSLDTPFRIAVAAVADRRAGALLDNDEEAGRRLLAKENGLPLSGEPEMGRFLRSLRGWGVETLVEALPTDIRSGQPAVGLVLQALSLGLHVVTVDKGAVVHAMDRFQREARRSGVGFAFTGTTGIRPPAFPPGCEVVDIEGVLNGTTNHILSRMLDGTGSFAQALREAQESGIAEADPSLDVDGWDTAFKILLLAKQCMHTSATLSDVRLRGLGPAVEPLVAEARATGSAVRLIGAARLGQGGVRLSVSPEIVGPASPFLSVSGMAKAALFRTRKHGTFFSNAVSGLDAIARVVLADIVAVSGE